MSEFGINYRSCCLGVVIETSHRNHFIVTVKNDVRCLGESDRP